VLFANDIVLVYGKR